MEANGMVVVGVSRVVIQERAEDLKHLMHQQAQSWSKERVQMLYLLQSDEASSVTHAAALLGRGRIILHRWLAAYEQGGLMQLLDKQTPPGRACAIPVAAQRALEEKLSSPTGFGSYGEIQDWLATEYQHRISDNGIHKHVRYRLGAKPKCPRPVSGQQDAAQVAFFKTT
jgi:transposase